MSHPFDWKKTSSAYIVNDQWLKVRADACELPNKDIIEPYYVLEYPTWINVVAITPDDQVVLVRLYRHGIGKTVLELPAGNVEKTDTTVLAAARRELLEETGFGQGHFIETGQLSPNTANHANTVYSYLATNVELIAKPVEDATEQIEVILLPLSEMIQLACDNGFHQAMHMGSIFFALNHLGQVHFNP